MLTEPSIEKLKEKSASPYDLAVLVSKRARELTDGAQPMIDDTNAANVVSLACSEVAADKVVAVKGDVEDEAVIPITREEKIRRREEAENRRKMLEEERAERMSVAGGLNSKGLDDLIDALAGGGASDEEEEVVYDEGADDSAEDEE
ncbi:MAG: DNA-directed RNA polymerase subunit omega [Clostridiales bacterium]|nr:DNA-directed RNA polymerase subunit omega [Clostridiales bacterium]